MDNGCSAAVLENIRCGIFACDADPAGIDLGLESVGGDIGIKNIERVFAVKLFELEIMVMIEKLNALLIADIGNLLYVLYRAVKASVPGRLSSGR